MTIRLVPRPGAGELLGVQRLADVVGGGTEAHGIRIEAERGPARSEPVDELAGDVVHESEVGHQTWRRVDVGEQRRNLLGQGPELHDAARR